MNLRRARSIAAELRQTFHQTAMREAGALMERAYELADSPLADDAAAARLRGTFSEQTDRTRAVAYCLDWLGRARESEAADRAYRIAEAAATGGPVAPLQAARSALFGRIRAMTEMPIGQAYAELLALVPELAGVLERCEALPEEEVARLRWGRHQSRRIATLVGPDSTHPDPLVKTRSMARLLLSYVHILAGEGSYGTVAASLREIEQARRKELGEREGYTLDRLPGGRYRVSARGTIGGPRELP
jgi:hypothetical protein